MPNKWQSAGKDRRDEKDGLAGQQPESVGEMNNHKQQDSTRSPIIWNKQSFGKGAVRVSWSKRKVS